LWQQLDPPVITLTVDGYGVRSELAGLERLMMVPGSHDVAFGRGQAGTVKATVVLETEGQVRLEDALDRPMTLVAPSGTTAAGPLAVGSRLDVPGPSVWPWVTTGVGVAGLGAGVWLLMQAEADRAPAETDAAGVALETTQAEDAARWDQANETAFQGSLLAGVGGALVLGGLTWWWLEDDASPVAIAPTPGGVIVGGRF
jgi:hypothetical protein